MRTKSYLISSLGLMLLLIAATPALAVVGATSMLELYVHIQGVSATWGTRVAQYALGILWTTSLIAFAIGCKDLALSGGLQLEGIIALFVRFAFLTGMMSWLLLNPARLLMIPNSLEQLGGLISGTPISFSNISSAFYGMMTPILDYYRGLSWFTEPGLCIVSCVLVFLIHCLSVLFVTTVLLVKIETIFILVGGMFTAAFFVIGQFRDIFMGYVKALVMNGLKLLLMSLCLGLAINIMGTWGAELQGGLTVDGGLYDVALPMTFGLMAFYIVIKSVPQYAIAILTGHASADGGLGKAAVMAGIAAGATVWNTSRGISNTALSTASTVNNAAHAYKSTSAANSAVSAATTGSASGGVTSGGGVIKSPTWAAIKAAMSTPVGRGSGGGLFGGGGGGGTPVGGSGNEMKPGGAFDPYKAAESYENKGGKS